MKKLANRLTEELTEKNLVIENMRVVNKEINARLGEVTREFHVYRMGEAGMRMGVSDMQQSVGEVGLMTRK